MRTTTTLVKVLFLVGTFFRCLFASADIPGYVEIDCLCNPSDTMSAVALRSTGNAHNYPKLIAVDPKTDKVIKIKTPEDYTRLPLGTKVYAPENLPPISTAFSIKDRSILQLCRVELEKVEINECVTEIVRLNSIRTCSISSLTEPVRRILFVPQKFLIKQGQLSIPGVMKKFRPTARSYPSNYNQQKITNHIHTSTLLPTNPSPILLAKTCKQCRNPPKTSLQGYPP